MLTTRLKYPDGTHHVKGTMDPFLQLPCITSTTDRDNGSNGRKKWPKESNQKSSTKKLVYGIIGF